jgi:tetratricopeptide (TPR) repeat protein
MEVVMEEQYLLSLLDLLKKQGEDATASSESVNMLASLVDAAEDARREDVLVEAIQISEVVEKCAAPVDACLIRYLRSNAWSALQHIRSTEDSIWNWEQPELVKQIYWLRGAIQHEGFETLPSERRAQIYCNLGNTLSQAGRFIDALVEWRNALKVQPILGMARGNLGIGLVRYGRELYDEGHAYWFLRSGCEELRLAIEGGVGRDGATYPEALEGFRSHLESVERDLNTFEGPHDEPPQEFPLGETKREQQYRMWCLRRNLFLNPLNDIGANSIAADDVLVLPSHRVAGAGITYRAFFNQLKQEYIYARWCLFDGVSRSSVHFADREVLLESNADFAQYSIGLEQVKTAFRFAYSLLDKVAYFVNAYWNVGMSEKQVNFRKVWYEDKKGQEVPVGHVRQVC